MHTKSHTLNIYIFLDLINRYAFALLIYNSMVLLVVMFVLYFSMFFFYEFKLYINDISNKGIYWVPFHKNGLRVLFCFISDFMVWSSVFPTIRK